MNDKSKSDHGGQSKVIKRRSRHFLDRQQIRFGASVVFYAALFPLLFLALLSLLTKVEILITGKVPEQGVLHETLQTRALSFAFEHIWLIAGTLVYVGLLTMIFSQRIFGPIRVFDNAIQDRLENPGEQVNCRLRKKDYFKSFGRRLEQVLNVPVSAGEDVQSENEPD
jgi:hypothetical protein